MSEKKPFNTITEFEMLGGTKVDMTLTFYSLYQLKPKNKPLYDRYNKIMTKGPTDELETVTILYTAYQCANLDKIENCMSEEEFIKNMPYDRGYVAETLKNLTQVKKK